MFSQLSSSQYLHLQDKFAYMHYLQICMMCASLKFSPLDVSLGCQGTPPAHRPHWRRQKHRNPGQTMKLIGNILVMP